MKHNLFIFQLSGSRRDLSTSQDYKVRKNGLNSGLTVCFVSRFSKILSMPLFQVTESTNNLTQFVTSSILRFAFASQSFVSFLGFILLLFTVHPDVQLVYWWFVSVLLLSLGCLGQSAGDFCANIIPISLIINTKSKLRAR